LSRYALEEIPTNRADFTACSRLGDELIGKVTKEQIADVARLLALNIGYDHEKYGDVA
jgi:hypothetical protein